MRIVTAILFGLPTLVLVVVLAFCATVLFFADAPWTAMWGFALILLTLAIGAWAIAAWRLARGAASPGEVMRRGFLLGAVEWGLILTTGLAMAFGVIGKETVHSSGTAGEGVVLMAITMASATVFVALPMLLVFLVGCAVTSRLAPRSGRTAL